MGAVSSKEMLVLMVDQEFSKDSFPKKSGSFQGDCAPSCFLKGEVRHVSVVDDVSEDLFKAQG